MNQLNIKNLIGKSFKLYSENFSLFTGIASVSFIIWLVEFAITYLRRGHEFLSLKSVGFVIGIIFLVIYTAMTIVLTTAISKRYNNEYVDLEEIFLSWRGRIGRFIGVMLVFVLASIIPLIVVAIIYAFITAALFKYILLGLIAIPVIYLMTIYAFFPYVAILENKNINSFSMSKNLVKNHFWKVMVVLAISFIIVSSPSYLIRIGRDYIAVLQSVDHTYVELITRFIVVFTGTLSSVFHISLYHTLKDNSETIIANE